ncbi:dermonecrotic toxin domain-containing protein [Pseudomonas sp. PSKL.D1]|uniref:dermonecrotic toxin domain-containing protein n=1 Tax=Pseudomonas sp. PSKL.D1 TaxID=3029060 RepID=UPI0023813D80|nr:DUF6543 domain-containing protein [Pseudomonas sp. PSKL.D1]WDY58432.1 hypothetical protein PVV54_01980 [Pseudomonas sp. PSKL.D1]
MTDAASTSTVEPPLQQRLIEQKMPGWLADLETPAHQHMRTALGLSAKWFEKACQLHPDITRNMVVEYGAHRRFESELRKLLKQIPDIEQFAAQRLTSAVKQHFNLDLDVSKTYLFNASKASAYQTQTSGDPVIGAARSFKLAMQSLLHSAMQNFEADEAQPGGLDTPRLNAAVLDSNALLGVYPSGNPVDISPTAFAGLARELDIGGNYQQLIAAPCKPGSTLADALGNVEQSALRLELHKAYLSEAIDQPVYQAMLDLVQSGQAEYQGSPIRGAFLQLFDSAVTGALIFGVVPSPELLLGYDPLYLPYKDILITYLPGAAIPLKQHATAQALQAYLREQLWTIKVHQLLDGVPARESTSFFHKLQDALHPIDRSTTTVTPGQSGQTVTRVRDPNAWVPVTVQPLGQGVVDALVAQKQQRLRDDALFHAVPTAMEDQKSAHRRMAYFAGLAFDAMSLGAFFIPGLGPLMLGLTTLQLSYEVFEGFESWADGDRQEAVKYLVDVLENVAFMAALGAAGGSGGTPAVERIPVEVPSFIEELRPVSIADGSTRLWAPDLQPFAHDIVLPAGLKPDEFGLYHHQGKTWLPLDGKLYSVKPAMAVNTYTLAHPDKPLSYEPPLQHNGAGAWLHELDNPEQWQGMRLFRRLGHLNGEFDDQTAAQLLSVAGIEEDVLRRTLSNSQRLPALLEDTMQRFWLDQQIIREHADATPNTRSAAFKVAYEALPGRQEPGAAILQRIYPQLPGVVTEELLRNVTSGELAALVEGRVPMRLGEEIRVYQQQVRLSRAYEGLFLEAVHNADSDQLILNTVPLLESWPQGLRLELHEGRFKPGLIDSVGPDEAQSVRIITRYPTGYSVTTPFPSSPAAPLHTTLFDALFTALALPDVVDAKAIRRLLQQAPQLPRATLRKKLGMQRRSFRSPMRLADGRVGYPLSPLVNDLARIDRFTRFSRLLTRLGVPQEPAEWFVNALLDSPVTDDEVLTAIAQLPVEHVLALQASLDAWRAEPVRLANQQLGEYSRDMIGTAIWVHWAQHALPRDPDAAEALYLHTAFIEEFPETLPVTFTSGVKHLQLDDVVFNLLTAPEHPADQLEQSFNRLFRHFPDLQILSVGQPYAPATLPEWTGRLPLVGRHFPNLRELKLINLNLVLSAQDIDLLARPAALEYLDLAGNTLAPAQDAVVGGWQLQFLGMDRMSLNAWPHWLNVTLLGNIEAVSLCNNPITQVPSFLRINEVSDQRHTIVSLEGSSLPGSLIQQLAISEDGQPRRFAFNLDITPQIQQRIRLLADQRADLREGLNQWVTARPTLLASRALVAQALIEFWESRVRGFTSTPLHLENLNPNTLPQGLPSYFTEAVDRLVLESAELGTAQLNTLLRPFSNLATLAIYECVQSLPALPAALAELPTLVEIELVNIGLQIDNEAMALLARLPALEVLDLSENRLHPSLQGPLHFAGQLKSLSLGDVGMETWPGWLFDVMPSQLLDLEANQLTQLPRAMLEAVVVDDDSTTIALTGNPLDEDTLQHISTQGQRLTFQLPHGFNPR